MVPEQFPLFKLATQLARQLSAPVALRIKTYARAHPRFWRLVCMRTAQLYHVAELRFKMWSLRLPQPRVVPLLSDTQALNVGEDILGEFVVFTMGSAILIFEVNRQAEIKEDKELAEKSQWVVVAMQLEELRVELALQQLELDRLSDTLARLRRLRDSTQLATDPPPPPPPFHHSQPADS